jgi:TPR repeat protein
MGQASFPKKLFLARANACDTCVHADTASILVLMDLGKYGDAIGFLNSYLRSNPGDPWALANRGMSYMRSGKALAAVADWKLAAAAGNAFSQCQLGLVYETGIAGVLDADPAVGDEWLRRSALQGKIAPTARQSIQIQPQRST